MILSPMTLFWVICEYFLCLVGIGGSEYDSEHISGFLIEIEFDEPISGNMQGLTIFSRWISKPCMSILITYLESSRKIKSDEYDVIDM
jgi:hypothetical protein